ncbi:MAG: hypothetical protein K2K52_01560 [Paramuribaculum sp.]|nr:hypothetical protein [Paramuribaculum sp.]
MEAFLVYCTVLGYIIPLLIGWAGFNKANKKNRSPLMWGIICWLTGLIGYIVLCCSSTLDYDEELGFVTEDDTLGSVMMVLTFVWAAFLLWIFYGNGVKALGF